MNILRCNGKQSLLESFNQIRRVRRQIDQVSTVRADQFFQPGDLVSREVVHEQNITRLKCRSDTLFDVTIKHRTIDRAGQQQRGSDPRPTDHGQGLGILSTTRSPGAARPYRRLRSIFTLDSSRNMKAPLRFPAAPLPWQRLELGLETRRLSRHTLLWLLTRQCWNKMRSRSLLILIQRPLHLTQTTWLAASRHGPRQLFP
jgi:hypothetical protein